MSEYKFDEYNESVGKLLMDIPVPLALEPNQATTIGYYAQLAVKEIARQKSRIEQLEAERLALAELVLHLNRSLSRPLIGEEIIDVSKARSIVEQANNKHEQ